MVQPLKCGVIAWRGIVRQGWFLRDPPIKGTVTGAQVMQGSVRAALLDMCCQFGHYMLVRGACAQ